jgi:hypothetical protein
VLEVRTDGSKAMRETALKTRFRKQASQRFCAILAMLKGCGHPPKLKSWRGALDLEVCSILTHHTEQTSARHQLTVEGIN